MWAKFQILSGRATEPREAEKKHVVYCIKIQREGDESQYIIIERRYTDFLELYNSLSQIVPGLSSQVSFPRKVIIGNFSPELIKTRLVSLEKFLKVVSESHLMLNSAQFKTFLIGHEEKLALKLLKSKRYWQAKPLLEKNFWILNKIYTEKHPAVIIALCRLAACCSADPICFEDAKRYADLALRRFEGISDVDLLCFYIPLLQMCARLYRDLGKDQETLEMKLNSLKRSGHKVDGCPSLLDSVLAV